VDPVTPPVDVPEAAAAAPGVAEEPAPEPKPEPAPAPEPEAQPVVEASAEADAVSEEASPTPATDEQPATEAAATPDPEPARPASLEDAVKAGDAQVILRELYKEVTAIAEGIWTKDIPPPARVWEKVSVSDWYENGFSSLGLRPLSDFYDIIAKVDKKMRDGAKKEELQEFLKESNFAQTLLALRDMFQKNQI
jgi:hypothetical protein